MGLLDSLNQKREHKIERKIERKIEYKKENKNENNLKEKIDKFRELLKQSDAILIGAGAGLSTSAGLSYTGKRFEDNFTEFIQKYGMEDMYSAGFYPFDTQEEKWAYWSKQIFYNRYDVGPTKLYQDLHQLVGDKNYFILTTNVDHQFWLSGFEDSKIFATQGDYGLFQCAKSCHKKLYDNESEVRAMIAHQKNCRIPKSLVPKCPVCGGDIEVNLRCDGYFVEDEKWHESANRYTTFLEENKDKKILFWELGVGMNTPGIIKYPFWQMTNQWEKSYYLCINKGQAWSPEEISDRSVCIDGDIGQVLKSIGGLDG